MKFAHLILGFLVLNISAVLVHFGGVQQELNQKFLRYENTHQADMAAVAYVARVNDMRAKMPSQPLGTTLAILQPYLPTGFTVRQLDWSERNESHRAIDVDYVVERTGPPRSPFLVIYGDGLPLTHYVQTPSHAHEGQPSK